MSGLLNSNLNNSASNLQDSSGRPFTASFSGQSGSVPGAFHHSGLHNIHANFNLPNMPGSLAQRNAAMSGLPSSGVQQPGGSISARFASNNLPVGMSQVLMILRQYCDYIVYADGLCKLRYSVAG
jgi:CCR4-NOT transcription complex subunit 2